MSDKQETLADIVAEFREIVHKSVDGIIAVKADVIADRIEAAAKREELRWAKENGELAKMLTFEKAQGGNAAAMREALEAIRDEAYERIIDGLATDANWLYKTAKAALAKPPRNCDIYDSKSCRMAYHMHGDGLMTMQAFADWIFATATELKGGNDGK